MSRWLLQRRGKIRFLCGRAEAKLAWYGDVRCERKPWTVPAHPAHSPDLALSDSHFFGTRKDASRKKEFESYKKVIAEFQRCVQEGDCGSCFSLEQSC